jgi:peptide/nickel transport system substrate-binding protein
MRRTWHVSTMQRRGLAAVAALALTLPLLLAACGGKSPTATAAPAATAVRTASTTVPGTATTAGTAPTTAAGSAIIGTTTASGSAVAGTAAAGGDPRGTAPPKRGGGGTLHLLWWQAPVILSVHRASGTKDNDAAHPILEALAVTSINSTLPDVPLVAKEIPSRDNGEVAVDGLSVTWKLKDGVKWSDGTPFTAADVKATWQFIMKPESAATTTAQYESIAAIDTPDTTTVKITFKQPTALWYTPFTNANGVVMQKAQLDACTDPKSCGIDTAPIGTGPYKVKSFVSGDNVQYAINDNYRDPTGPFFDAVDLKGGGDAGTAAKAVQTGQADFAWNLQVTPDVLKQVTDSGKVVDTGPGFGVEHIVFNFTDPNKDVDGEKSSVKAPHPFLTDPKVREAMSWLVDRDAIAKNLYGPAGKATCNILLGIPPALQSKNTTCGYDVAKANQILDADGWAKGSDGIRAKNGVPLKVTFSTSINPVREKEEQVMKAAFQQAGIGMDIKNADAGVFFGTPDNPDQNKRFENDLEMFTNGPGDPDAQDFLQTYTTAQIPQKANGWQYNNTGRWSNPEFDNLYNQLTKELNPEKRAQLEVQMNDLIVNDHVVVPMVDRYAANGHRADLINTNYTPWDSALWNIAYWQIRK